MANSDSKLVALSHLREALARAFNETSEEVRLLAVGIEVPTGGAGHLLDLDQAGPAVYFSGGQDPYTYVGLGAAEQGAFSGEGRFRAAAAFVQDIFTATHIPAALVPHVRFFGGAAFSPGRDGGSEAWRGFGEAQFILPRCICVLTNKSHREHSVRDATPKARTEASETIVFSGQTLFICLAERNDFGPTLDLAADALDALFQPRDQSEQSRRTCSAFIGEDRVGFHTRVERIKEAIASGTVQKVVAARRVTLTLSEAPRAADLMESLQEQAPLCARFALRIGNSTFVGATPERLVEKRGLEITTEALAGSVSSHQADGERLLLESSKDLEEHALVVQALKQALSPVCTALTLPEKPTVRRLRTILHLRTPVSGKLAEPTHVLSLVDRLHPTPAVGGLPKEPAIKFIAQEEPAERGWYAAPVGWIDSRGDGEFVVALRSGLFTENRVHLYSGAGIVRDSDPAQEYEETELKLLSMLGALGVSPDRQSTTFGGDPGSENGPSSTAKGAGKREAAGLGAHEKSPERPHEFPSV